MSQELVTRPAHAAVAGLAAGAVRAIVPETFDEVYRFSQAIAKSGLAPYGMDTPEKVMISILTGLEVGAKPMQSVQGIAVIGNRPSIWGDLALALVRQSGELEEFSETYEGKAPEHWPDPKSEERLYKAVCTVKRRGYPAVTQEFSIADAIVAKLWNKTGPKGPTPWVTNPKRMLRMRARGFSLRDTFTDVLKGMILVEELQGNEELLERGEEAPPRRRRSPPPAPTTPAPAANDTHSETTAAAATAPVQDAEFSEHDARPSAVREDSASEQTVPPDDHLLVELEEAYGTAASIKACDDLDEFYVADLEGLTADGRERARVAAEAARKRVRPVGVSPAPVPASEPAPAAQRDPFAVPEGFAEEAGYAAWVEAGIAAVTDEASAKRLHEAWTGSKDLRADTPVSDPIWRALQAKVTSTLAPYRSKPQAVSTAQAVDLTKIAETLGEYEAQLAARIATCRTFDDARALKKAYLSIEEGELRLALGVTNDSERDRVKKPLWDALDRLRPQAA